MAYFNSQSLLKLKSQRAQGFDNDLLSTEFLLNQIAKSLVDYPEKVAVNKLCGNNTCVLELKVAKEDIGKVIGRHGRTAQAMRTILSAVSSKNKEHLILEILG